jgi:hypothetical protein
MSNVDVEDSGRPNLKEYVGALDILALCWSPSWMPWRLMRRADKNSILLSYPLLIKGVGGISSGAE